MRRQSSRHAKVFLNVPLVAQKKYETNAVAGGQMSGITVVRVGVEINLVPCCLP